MTTPHSFTATDRRIAMDLAKKIVTSLSKHGVVALANLSAQHPHPHFLRLVELSVGVLMCDQTWCRYARN